MIICPDDLLIDPATGEYAWSPEGAYAAWVGSRATLTQALTRPDLRRLVMVIGLPGAGKTTWAAANPQDKAVVLDEAGLCRRSKRRPLIQQALATGWRVEAVVLDVPFATCVARNDARQGLRRVPDDKMVVWRNALQGGPPDLAEGFASITVLKGG